MVAGFSTVALGAFAGSTILGFASLASVGGFGLCVCTTLSRDVTPSLERDEGVAGVGALVARAELLEGWGPGAHGSTYGGNPLACAAALETIALLETGLVENAEIRGHQALAGLAPLRARFPKIVREVRGKGLMIGIEFETREHADAVQSAAFQRGLLVLEAGHSVVRMSPALTVSSDEIETALWLFSEAVAEVASAA